MHIEATYDGQLSAYEVKFIKLGRRDWDQINGIITLMKVAIPASDRTYDPATKIWTIHEKHWQWLKDVTKAMLVRIDLKTQKKIVDTENFHYAQVPALPSKTSLAEQLAKLLLLDRDIHTYDLLEIKKLYRRKALELHPDRNNGDGAAMSELNSIWSAYNAN